MSKGKGKIRLDCTYPVAGIGASASRLSTFTKLIRAIPGHYGIAYVLVRNSEPNHYAALAGRLQKVTSQITDEAKAGPDYIYIIPGAKVLAAIHRI